MRVVVYRDESGWIDGEEIADYLGGLGAETEVRPSLLVDLEPESIAETRVRDATSEWQEFTPLRGEVDYEERMNGEPEKIGGVMYDAHRMAERLEPETVGSTDTLNLVLTDRLLGTYSDGRYHARTVYLGSPSMVSGDGLVQGPAKPDSFYREKTTATGDNVPAEIAKEKVEGDFLEPGDPRATEVAKGMALQAAVYRATGEPFCDDPGCRLYNAHEQGELLEAQLDGGLCGEHRELVNRIFGEED